MSSARRGILWLAAIVILHSGVNAEPAPTAEEAPLDAGRQAAIDRYVAAEMKRERISGLMLGIYRQGWPIYLKGYGVADLEWQVPVGPDTRMQTGSLGKQFVAAAILKLAEEGKIDIDASITRYFPEAPASWKPIKVANLLSHTSGIGIYDAPALTKPGGEIDFHRDYSEDQLAAATLKLPLDFPVGTDWRYNNTNYMMLGILIHRVTGQFYGDWLRDRFFAPLGMRATRVISDTDVIERRASGYEIKGGVVKNQAWVSATFNATADGTIYTTVEDMARWDRALTAGTVLKPSVVRADVDPVPSGGRQTQQGRIRLWLDDDADERPPPDRTWRGVAGLYQRDEPLRRRWIDGSGLRQPRLRPCATRHDRPRRRRSGLSGIDATGGDSAVRRCRTGRQVPRHPRSRVDR